MGATGLATVAGILVLVAGGLSFWVEATSLYVAATPLLITLGVRSLES
jgi:hypothetical protein